MTRYFSAGRVFDLDPQLGPRRLAFDLSLILLDREIEAHFENLA